MNEIEIQYLYSSKKKIIQAQIEEKPYLSQKWLACLAISKWFSGEMLDGTYLTSRVSKPRSLIHINLPMSIICLHINPKAALSIAFIFLTKSSTPIASPLHSPPLSLSQHLEVTKPIAQEKKDENTKWNPISHWHS